MARIRESTIYARVRWWMSDGYLRHLTFAPSRLRRSEDMKVDSWRCFQYLNVYMFTFADFVGCYSKGDISPMTTILANYPSMTVTLCKQLCLGSDYSQAGIGNVDCFCGTSGDLWGLTPASADNTCNTICNGNALQYCGGTGSKISLFDIGNQHVFV